MSCKQRKRVEAIAERLNAIGFSCKWQVPPENWHDFICGGHIMLVWKNHPGVPRGNALVGIFDPEQGRPNNPS